MAEISYNDETLAIKEGQTVLSALLEQGHAIPNSCRAGACQSCLMQAVEGEVPAAAQAGLKDTLKAQGYFLACSCEPHTAMKVVLPSPEFTRSAATVIAHDLLVEDVLRLRLSPKAPFQYHAGQYVTIWNPQDVGRSYSLTSVPELDDYLELHIRRISGGNLSAWLHDHVKVGDVLQIQAAVGDCFYVAGTPEQNLLLAGTGTGLSPLLGITRDALRHGHRGEIHLIHGVVQAKDLYMHEALQNMAVQYDNFHYHTSVLEADSVPDTISAVSLEEQITLIAPDPSDWSAYLCGDPAIVNTMKRKLFLSGASMSNIYTDPFLAAPELKDIA